VVLVKVNFYFSKRYAFAKNSQKQGVFAYNCITTCFQALFGRLESGQLQNTLKWGQPTLRLKSLAPRSHPIFTLPKVPHFTTTLITLSPHSLSTPPHISNTYNGILNALFGALPRPYRVHSSLVSTSFRPIHLLDCIPARQYHRSQHLSRNISVVVLWLLE
jgi:hypothetical protein